MRQRYTQHERNILEFLYEYGLFLAKTATFVIAVAVIIGLLVAGTSKGKSSKKGKLELTDLGERLQDHQDMMTEQLMTDDEIKQLRKEEKKRLKEEKKQAKKAAKEKAKNKDKDEDDVEHPSRVYVLKFNGSVDAHEVESLREEVTAILSIANKEHDQVLLKLESGGGVVHGYGLAASQLARIKDAEIPLHVVVDKVAASGGYMMACMADKLYCAPFAIIGSIGVIAQIPNFNRLLKKHDVDFEQVTAGEYKRTLTMFGENTEKARDKFKQELEEVHVLFKNFVQKYRPDMDIAKVATGEHWFGQQALELDLVDDLSTSDDLICKFFKEEKDIQLVEFKAHKKLSEKVAENMSSVASRHLTNAVQKTRHWYQ